MYRVPGLVFVFLMCVAGTTSAQAPTASIAGRVADSSHAVIVAAMVVAINAETNAVRDASTNGEGEYVLTNLAPGTYRVEVEKTGFRKLLRPDVIVHVGDALTLDLELALGGVTDAVTVEASAPLLNTRSASVSSVVDRTFVGNLPLNGRSFQSLIWMTPGVVLTPASGTSPGQFSVNGQRSDANYFMVDGVSANLGVAIGTGVGVQGAGAAPGLSAQGGTNSLVSVDALQEFRIESSTYAPEFGRMPGGQVSIVTRSGTNAYHGTLFEYFRDDALDSADYFVVRQGLAKPQERQHDFGGTLGGPIERDRTFMFASYEGLRLDQPKSAVTEVPSLASRAAASAAVQPLFAGFPLPNGPDTRTGLSQFSASYSDPSRLNATSVRIDHTVTPALTVFGRYNYAPSSASSRLGSFAIAGANTIGYLDNSLQTLTLGSTWIATPKISNDLRVNWSRNVGNNYQSMDDFGGAVAPPVAMLHPSFAPSPSAYQINLGGTGALFADGLNSNNAQRQINVVDSLLVSRARHQLKLGIDVRRLLPVYAPLNYVQLYTFAGATGALGGTASLVFINALPGTNHFSHATNFSLFGQDTWSVTPRLTVSYGLRWELNPPPGLSGDSRGALTLATADPANLALAPPGTPMYQTTYDNFAPRVGASYALGDSVAGRTVLRGGWGIFYDIGSDSVMENLGGSFPFVARRTLTNVTFPVAPALLSPPTIAPGAPADFLIAADPGLKLPYTNEWNAAVEQALGVDSMVTVSYVGAFGRRLLREERLLNPTPQFQQVILVTNSGHSRYDALQLKYTRRMSHGLQALASYTLAESMDNGSNDEIAVLPAMRVDPERDWGPSDFDVRHTFTAGATYAIPGAHGESWWNVLLRDWSVDGLVIARSALPVNVVTGTTAFGVSNALRPDLVPGVALYVDDAMAPGEQRLNGSAFTTPPLDASGNPLRQGAVGRNALRGFAMSQVDFAVHRDIPLGGYVKVQLRAEAFNVFDQTNLGAPTNVLSSGLFGQATRTVASSLGAGGVAGGGFSPLYQVGGPRSIQLAARLQF
ncbi:MAG TPA: carboxypeptidase regulatory-like domain-containing protein [Vicinamibacterales bacterium]|nr:carboxypeptidase regulatory-like domain-containing protein [Vicinamibacterales bacterium]